MFTTPCRINKNTKELREKLVSLGYDLEGTTTGKCDGDFIETYMNGLALSIHHDSYPVVDCGDNEDLFLALAALRDDSDYMQWFIYEHNGKVRWFQDKVCDREIEKYGAGHPINSRKATVEELIKHFSNEQRRTN